MASVKERSFADQLCGMLEDRGIPVMLEYLDEHREMHALYRVLVPETRIHQATHLFGTLETDARAAANF